jgi:rhodanese-related sulfurtransferase
MLRSAVIRFSFIVHRSSLIVMNISPTELQTLLATGDPPLLLDVREPWETEICSIAGSLKIPMRDIPARLAELPSGRRVAVICHHGMRSAMVVRYLLENGIDAVNVSGGVEGWAGEVDPAMPRY